MCVFAGVCRYVSSNGPSAYVSVRISSMQASRVRATNYIYVCMCACIYIYIYKFVDTLHMHILLHNMSFYSHM